ncbi:unnamed protein product [Darwinula stevensoni]|uniref:Lipase n=1 Tax=Darwinula stevensoni TaxID=69355 RepID=A0A7R8XHQ0_9CRUS|nr:unnamed protein product [Darwinula stevensoni]CAG0893022.1 unnamed protein product [Darwinula stevensoni]
MSRMSMLTLVLLSLASSSLGREWEVIEDRRNPHRSLEIAQGTWKEIPGGPHRRVRPPRTRPATRDDDTTQGLIEQFGYPVETHTVTTADGYIIDMHRIPYGLSGPGEGPRIPVLLQHGLLCSSADWVISGPESGLGFLLADEGYDVWLGNVRGNTYGRRHVSLSPGDDDFWTFSWDQMGELDLPAMLDKMLEVTGQDKFHYAGHSMGTIMFWVMSDMRPEYRDHFLSMHAMGPVSRVDHMMSPIAIIAPWVDEIQWLLEMLGLHEFLPSSAFMDLLASLVCDDWSLPAVCSSILFLLCGFDEAQLNETMLPLILSHTPAGTSTQNLVHFAQEVNAEKFQHYDWGKDGNLEHYGQEEPPEYDLSKVNAAVFLYWGQNDWLAAPDDVQWLSEQLHSLIGNFRVDFDDWNHLDFLWGIDAKILVYDKLIEMMKLFDP